MVAGPVAASVLVAASLLQQQSTNMILAAAILIGGAFAWRQKRGDFYKAVAEEKTAEAERLRSDNERLRHATDITPILDVLKTVTATLERSLQASDAVVQKVSEMNGSLRAHSVAMEALADRLVLDEAARGLLATAATDQPRTAHSRRRTP